MHLICPDVIRIDGRNAEDHPIGDASGKAVTNFHNSLLQPSLYCFVARGEPVCDRFLARPEGRKQALRGNRTERRRNRQRLAAVQLEALRRIADLRLVRLQGAALIRAIGQ